MLFPLVAHKAMELVHHRLAVSIAELRALVQSHQGHSGAAALPGPLFQLCAEHPLQILAVVHTGQKIVAHIVAAQLPFPGRHALFGQDIACQRCRHLQLPALAVRFHDAAQHTVHPSAAQLIVHLQAFVLPAGFRLFFGQADAVKHRLCSLHKTVQILLGPLFFHCIFPIIMHRAAVHRQLTDSRHSPGTHSHYNIQAGPLPAERTIFYWNFCIFVRLPNNLQSARRN